MAHLLSKGEAAARLGISVRTLERWIADGRLPASKPSPGTVRIDDADIDQLIEASKTTKAVQ